MPEINNEKNSAQMDESSENLTEIEEINPVEEAEEGESSAGNDLENCRSEEEVSDESEEVEGEDIDQEETVFDDDEHFAAVAERITGARHSVAATAAPLRIRDATGHVPTLPKPTAGIPVRSEMPVQRKAPMSDSQPKIAGKKAFELIIASACALILLLSTMVVIVNVVTDENRPADLNIGETPEDAQTITPDDMLNEVETSDETEPADTDSVDSDSQITPLPEETATETEPETEPEAEKYTVKLDFYDREDVDVITEAITLADLLASIDCTLTDADVPSVSLDSMIAADAVITIDKLEYKTETVTEVIAYQSEVIEIDTIPRGTVNYLQYGENGEVARTYTVEYRNGVEQSRTVSSEETTKWPVNEKYELGVGGTFVGADGITYTYSHRRVVAATYYNIEGLTYLGTMADETVVAVDKDNIPLGTKLYVKNDKYDFGVRIASDIGSMIDDWEVDIWLSPNNPQLPSFAEIGYHYDMEIYYID